MRFLAYALDLLQNAETPPGLKEAACAALIAGLDEHLDVPTAAPLAIWTWIRESTSKRWCAAPFSLGEFRSDDVFKAAVEAVQNPASGNSLREVAFDVLSGPAFAGRVDEDVVANLVDREIGDPHHIVRLIQRVHSARGLSSDFLRGVRDRWAASPMPTTRQAAVEVAAITADPDEVFWRRMIDDPSEDVRCAVASQLRRKEVDPKFGLAIVRQRLEREQVSEVQVHLHRAMGTLLRLVDE